VLPADYDTMYDEAAMRAVLLHELAHVAQRDCWWKLLLVPPALSSGFNRCSGCCRVVWSRSMNPCAMRLSSTVAVRHVPMPAFFWTWLNVYHRDRWGKQPALEWCPFAQM
jgi:hypothetical protein